MGCFDKISAEEGQESFDPTVQINHWQVLYAVNTVRFDVSYVVKTFTFN